MSIHECEKPAEGVQEYSVMFWNADYDEKMEGMTKNRSVIVTQRSGIVKVIS
jgi:hypothetical protein